MNKIIDRINIRNVQDLYDIKNVTETGQIVLKDKQVAIYKVDPANIVACDEETKYKIYQAYITCIRSLPDTIQVIASRERADFNEQIEVYKKRIKEIENEKLKLAIQKYIDYLEEISNVNKLYKISHYLIIENMKKDELEEITNVFSNMQEFGVKVRQINSKEQAKNILRKFIIKEI